jgi:hypothetical protein
MICSVFGQTWDAVIMAFLLYTTFSVPYLLAFVNDSDPSGEFMKPMNLHLALLDRTRFMNAL